MLVKNACALVEGKFRPETSLLLRDGKIVQLSRSPAEGEEAIDLGGDYLVPGFVDVHIHAFMGKDMMQGGEAVRHMSRELKKQGVAAFLPTTMSLDAAATRRALEGVCAVMRNPEKDGAAVLGAHMEAPFLSQKYAGAQRSEFFCDPTMENWRSFTGDAEDCVRLVTLAPEKPGAAEMIRYLHTKGIAVSAGHSGATNEQLRNAAAYGLNHVTHLFNAQSGFTHRVPGIPGAALTEDSIFCEVIADGIHLHRDAVILAYRCKGAEKLVCITDAAEAAGMPDGEYQLGGQRVTKRAGAVRLMDGTLAGSALTMAQGFTNLVRFGIPPEEASRITSKTPAESIGLQGYGDIRPGFCSILARFDRNWNFVETVG